MVAFALTIGGWFISAFLNKTIDRLKVYLEDNRNLYVGIICRLENLNFALSRIEDAIDAIESWPIKKPRVVTWLRHLKDAAYCADDIVDDLESKFINYQFKDKNKVHMLMSSLLENCKHTILTDDDLKNLKKITERLEKIYADINSRQPKEYEAPATRMNRFPFPSDEFIGRNIEINNIVHMLLRCIEEEGTSGIPKFVVLPIIGIGGVGKTALAINLFEDTRLAERSHFSLRAWLDVSGSFDIGNIEKKLISIFSKNRNMVLDDHNYDKNSSAHSFWKLKNIVKNQRFLIVLDDVWNVKSRDWRLLQKVLVYGARGSTILVTTQHQEVAKTMQSVEPIKLDVLKQVDYERLIIEGAFGNSTLEEGKRKRLQVIASRISKILQGLPSAGIALGNLLSSNLDPDYWKIIANSEWWEHNSILETVLPSLALHLQNLDSSHKLCFAYCSIFPRDYIFEKKQLVHMWMAQGFIQPRKTVKIEDTGMEVLAELTNWSLLQKISENEYIMHNIVRELAIYFSLDECFVVTDEIEEIPQGVRHLAVRTNRLHAFNNVSRVKSLRTILFCGTYEGKEFYNVLKGIVKYSKSLRVVDLSNCCTDITNLPKGFSNLSHLRYLDISNSNICWLPKLFCKLCRLQVLKVQHCNFHKLPKNMNRLISLRHLSAELKTIAMISGIGRLTGLQELKQFPVKKEKGHKIDELRMLNQLRGQLQILNIENVDSKQEALDASLKEKQYLNSLHLYFDTKDEPETEISTGICRGYSQSNTAPNLNELFEALEPSCEITEVEIKGYNIDIFPSWLIREDYFTFLRSIHLSCGKLTSLPPLGELRFLEVLHIEAMLVLKKIGAELYGRDVNVFPSLEELKLQELPECEEWSEVCGLRLFPSLKRLHIKECLKLTTVALLNLNLPVTELNIESCGNLGTSLPECLQRFSSLTILKIALYPHNISLPASNLLGLKMLHVILPGNELRRGFSVRHWPEEMHNYRMSKFLLVLTNVAKINTVALRFIFKLFEELYDI